MVAGLFAVAVAAAGDVAGARRFYEQTNYPAAIARLNGAADYPSLLLLGQSYFLNGDLKKATDTLERAAALNSASSDAYLWLGRAYGRRAETAFPLAAPPLAIKSRQNFERAVELDPKNWEAADDLFEFYLNAPGFLGGGLEKASRMADVIARHDPAEAAHDHAKIAEQRKQFDTAEAQLRRAVQLAPQRAGKVVALARFLAKRGRFEESDQTFQKAMTIAPNTPEILYLRADTLVESNRNLPEARELLKKYIAMDLGPKDPPRKDAEKLLRKVSGS